MKIGVIREEKVPPDSRVPLTPEQCLFINEPGKIQVVVQPSTNRCFDDESYHEAGISLQEDLSDCDVLMGVKEVPIGKLISNKTYFFFSHTIKKQSYNRDLLLAILKKNIRLLDYEVLTNERGQRLIAFGKFAGMVGAHNGVMTYGNRTGEFNLKRMKDCHDYSEAKTIYKGLDLPPMKIVVTGKGRVANGAAQVLKDMDIENVSPEDFLENEFQHAVFTQLDCVDYAAHKDGEIFNLQDFFQNPQNYESIFTPYIQASDLMINGIYWDNKAPAFFTKEEMKKSDFRIKVIADVTCDIAPVASIPSTLRASTIANPIFGYDPIAEAEAVPHQASVIDMMTIDNLPNELPRDASQAFGEQFIEHIFQELLEQKEDGVIERASVTQNGDLGKYFEYLRDYVEGKS
ncbi:MAG: NAD(P)-dependent oxidoreductase [Saprospiraceae bacterium]|nr:NAD(P)-dependent oxidoreductase [Saprospiraceae bacterium]